MRADKTYRLWTFQSIKAIDELRNKGILEVNWDDYIETGLFTKAYKWMTEQMVIRKTNCLNPPIWAWHSCDNYEKAPKLGDARSLLSDRAIERGIQTIEFECPANLVLLSSYGMWNVMLHEHFTSGPEKDTIDKKTADRLFNVSRRKFRRYDSIQAALPYLKLDWVKNIRELALKPNDDTFNWEEEV